MDACLTVVIPVAKTAYLRETLASIACQMSERIELLVVDSVEGLDLHPILDETMGGHAYRLEKTRGLPMVDNWNRCMAMVRTEWAYMISDDDLMQEGLLPALTSIIEQEQGIACVTFARHIYYMDEPEKNREPLPGRIVHSNYARWTCQEYFRRFAEGTIEYPWFGNWICRPAEFLRKGGFVRCAFGWGADTVGGLTNMIDGDVVYADGMAYHWRYSTKNVSAGFPHVVGAIDLAQCRAFWHDLVDSRDWGLGQEGSALKVAVDAFLNVQARKHSLRSTVANFTWREFLRRFREIRRHKNISLTEIYRGLKTCGVHPVEIWATAVLHAVGLARPVQAILRKR